MGNHPNSQSTSAPQAAAGIVAPLAFTAAPSLAFAAAISTGAALMPSSLWALLALLGFAGFVVALARVAPASVVLLAPLLVLRLSEFASGLAIESGAAMVETGTTGAASGGFAHRLLLEIALTSAAAWPIERAWRALRPRFPAIGVRWQSAAPTLFLLLTGLLALAGAILALLAARHGVPLIGQHDRFTYLAELGGTPYRSIMMNRPVIAPLIGILLAVPRFRRGGALLLGLLLLISILFGEKFTSLLLILGGAGIAPLLAMLASGRTLPVRSILIGLALFAVGSLPLVMISYGGIADPARAWTRLGERAAVQGQLWYLADRAGPPRAFDTRAVRADVSSWLDPTVQRAEHAGTRFGLYYVMARFTPTERLKLAERGGTGFVFALHPYLLLAGGLPLLLLGGLAVALFHGWALALLVEALIKGRWLAALAFARLVNSAYACLFTGFAWNMFGIKSLVTMAIGLALLRLPRLRILTVKPNSLNIDPQQV